MQEKLIPIVLAGNDLVGESKTGSGKPILFSLIFQTLNVAQPMLVDCAPKSGVGTQFAAFAVKSLVILKRRTDCDYVGERIKAVRLNPGQQPHF